MAITSINDVPFQRLPWLISGNVDDISKVENFVFQSQLELQTSLSKSDTDVNDETKYTIKEKLLVGLYTCLLLAKDKALINSVGVAGNAPSGNKVLTKTQADVVSAEFTTIKASDGSSVVINLDKMLVEFKNEVCRLAGSMGLSLEICSEGINLSPSDVGVSYGFTCGFDPCC